MHVRCHLQLGVGLTPFASLRQSQPKFCVCLSPRPWCLASDFSRECHPPRSAFHPMSFFLVPLVCLPIAWPLAPRNSGTGRTQSPHRTATHHHPVFVHVTSQCCFFTSRAVDTHLLLRRPDGGFWGMGFVCSRPRLVRPLRSYRKSRVAVGVEAELYRRLSVALDRFAKDVGGGCRPMQCRLGVFITNN